MDEFTLAYWVLGIAFGGSYLFLAAICTYLLVLDTQPEPKKEVSE